MIIFPESLFPPIAVSSEMKVELSAQDPEQQSPHVTSDEPLSPPSLLPLAFDRPYRPVPLCAALCRRGIQCQVVFVSCPNSTSLWRAGGIETTKSEIWYLVLSVHAECEKSLGF